MAQDTMLEQVVLSDDPQRKRLRELQARIDARQDAIAELDLEIETLREQLATFEGFYHAQLFDAHAALKRVEGLIDHLGRWGDVLHERLSVAVKGTRLDERRAKEVRQHPSPARPDEKPPRGQRGGKNADDKPAAFAPPVDKHGQLKDVYRALARRFHPDLAGDEETRVRHSQVMARINLLYRTGDLQGLIAMREKARGSQVDDSTLDVGEQIAILSKRLTWFDTVLTNLNDDRVALEQSATCELWRDAQQAEHSGRDLFAELRTESIDRLQRAYSDVPVAVHDLEKAVARYNRQQTARGVEKRKQQAVEQVFDPYVDKSLVRLALDDLNLRGVSASVRRCAADMEALAKEQAPLLRLVLFAAVSDLSPYPLSGLETFDDLQLRYDTLAAEDQADSDDSQVTLLALQEALVQADAWLEFGVKHANETLAHTGLRFRSDDARKAVPLALRSLAVRRQFKRVLSVLGERRTCSACHEAMFAVPLYRLRGLDDLRALVCPLCGETLSKYWMPRGKDVQAVLNATFVDYEIVSEWSFALARASIATQLTPVQLEAMTVGTLKRMLVADVFERHELAIKPAQVVVAQQGKVVPDRTPLLGLDKTRFRLQFRESAPMSENDALETVRHRIRNRFKA